MHVSVRLTYGALYASLSHNSRDYPESDTMLQMHMDSRVPESTLTRCDTNTGQRGEVSLECRNVSVALVESWCENPLAGVGLTLYARTHLPVTMDDHRHFLAEIGSVDVPWHHFKRTKSDTTNETTFEAHGTTLSLVDMADENMLLILQNLRSLVSEPKASLSRWSVTVTFSNYVETDERLFARLDTEPTVKRHDAFVYEYARHIDSYYKTMKEVTERSTSVVAHKQSPEMRRYFMHIFNSRSALPLTMHALIFWRPTHRISPTFCASLFDVALTMHFYTFAHVRRDVSWLLAPERPKALPFGSETTLDVVRRVFSWCGLAIGLTATHLVYANDHSTRKGRATATVVERVFDSFLCGGDDCEGDAHNSMIVVLNSMMRDSTSAAWFDAIANTNAREMMRDVCTLLRTVVPCLVGAVAGEGEHLLRKNAYLGDESLHTFGVLAPRLWLAHALRNNVSPASPSPLQQLDEPALCALFSGNLPLLWWEREIFDFHSDRIVNIECTAWASRFPTHHQRNAKYGHGSQQAMAGMATTCAVEMGQRDVNGALPFYTLINRLLIASHRLDLQTHLHQLDYFVHENDPTVVRHGVEARRFFDCDAKLSLASIDKFTMAEHVLSPVDLERVVSRQTPLVMPEAPAGAIDYMQEFSGDSQWSSESRREFTSPLKGLHECFVTAHGDDRNPDATAIEAWIERERSDILKYAGEMRKRVEFVRRYVTPTRWFEIAAVVDV